MRPCGARRRRGHVRDAGRGGSRPMRCAIHSVDSCERLDCTYSSVYGTRSGSCLSTRSAASVDSLSPLSPNHLSFAPADTPPPTAAAVRARKQKRREEKRREEKRREREREREEKRREEKRREEKRREEKRRGEEHSTVQYEYRRERERGV